MSVGAYKYIKEISGNSVNQINFDNIFSSIYSVYYITFEKFVGSHDDNVTCRLIDNTGTVITGNEYNAADNNQSTTGGLHQGKHHNQSLLGYPFYGTQSGGLEMYIFNPYESDLYTHMIGTGVSYTSTAGNLVNRNMIAHHYTTETIRGITFYTNTGNFSNTTIKAYGIKDA